jgi:hypothetical protein
MILLEHLLSYDIVTCILLWCFYCLLSILHNGLSYVKIFQLFRLCKIYNVSYYLGYANKSCFKLFRLYKLNHVAHSTHRKESTLTNMHRSQNVWHVDMFTSRNVKKILKISTLTSDLIVGLRECWLSNLLDILGGICRTWEYDRWYTWSVL